MASPADDDMLSVLLQQRRKRKAYVVAAVAAAVVGGQRQVKRPRGPRLARSPHRVHWYTQLFDPNASIRGTRQAKAFVRNLRVPPSEVSRLAQLVVDDGFWKLSRPDAAGRAPVPTVSLVMACLKMMGRAHCLDDASHEFGVGASTLSHFYHQFTECLNARFESECGPPSTVDQLEATMAEYAKRGLMGCIGSTDCVHIAWDRCSAAQRALHKRGDHSACTVVFQVSHRRTYN